MKRLILTGAAVLALGASSAQAQKPPSRALLRAKRLARRQIKKELLNKYDDL